MGRDLLEIGVTLAILAAAAPPVGLYMARVYAGERTFASPLLQPLEDLLLRLSGGRPAPQHWTGYAAALLATNAVGWLLLYGILRLQHLLPLNPAGQPAVPPDLAFNAAVSFVTNTNWQAYGGETALAHFSQTVGLTVQNFVSAATGMAVAAAAIRGFAGQGLGSFRHDLVRSIVHVLLPLSLLLALALAWQGVPQNYAAPVQAATLEGGQQALAQGPAAAQVAIKQLGTNGGGFFNANSAHPYENPTPLANLLETVAILLIPAAFCWTFGRMTGERRQGLAIFAAMSLLFLAGLAAVYLAEAHGNPLLAEGGLMQAGGNMEGKEVRFGIAGSALWAAATTAASNGSVNAMHDSFTPLGGLVLLLNMQLGEIVFGGVGAGFYGMLLFVVLTVFMAGLMVGRTPEYLGRRIEAREVKLAVLALLSMPLGILGFGALAASLPQGLAGIQEAGPHGLSELIYAYSSATANNGSAFAGFAANSTFHNVALGLCMLLGRYAFIVPMLAVAGSLSGKRAAPATAGTFPTHGPLFVLLLAGTILIVGGLTFFPVLALGPLAEHAAMLAGRTF